MRVGQTIQARVHSTWVGRRLRRAGGDDGFFLLESIVAIAILTIIMAALTAFFTETVHTTSLQRAKQTAVQVADAAVDSLRAVPATDLATGRDATSVDTQFSGASSNLKTTWLDPAVMKPSVDTSNSGASAVVPTTPTTTSLNGTTFSVSKYVGDCAAPVGDAAACTTANLTATPATSYVGYVRAVVAVAWPDSRCASNTCTYVTATLITKTVTDPTFNLNQAPNPAPVALSPGNQTSVVGDVITGVQLTMKSGTGVPTATWTSTSTLPAGITLNPDGTFSGSPTAATSAMTIVATLHDGFLRTATTSFTWTVLAGVTAAAPTPAPSSIVGTAITPVTLTASGGTGSPYTWTDPTGSLPPGLSLATVSNQGKISGTPTQAGAYPVTVTVTDSGGHTGTATWTWTVGNPPIVATNPGPRTSTKSAPASLSLTYTGGTGAVSWTATSLPPGLSITSAGVISGSPTTVATTNVTVTVTDSIHGTSSQTFAWSVVAAPTVTAPATQTSSVTGLVSLPLTTTCSNAPCSYALVNGPPGLTVGAAGVVTGTVGGSPTTYSSAKVTVTDASNVSATTAAFTWIVVAPPSVTAPGAQTSTVTGAVSLQLAASCPSAPCTYTIVNGPPGLSVSATGLITGPMGSSTGTYSTTKVNVVDGSGVSAASGTFTWTVLAAPSVNSPGPQTSTVNSTVSLQLTTSCPNSPCSYALANGPGGLTVSAAGRVTGTLGGSTASFPTAKVTVTDAGGVGAATATFAWSVVGAPTVNTPSAQNSLAGNTVNLQLTTSCPNAPCGYTLANGPAGLSVSPSGLVSGMLTSATGVYSSAKITVTDASGISVSTGTFTWTVTLPPAPTMTSPGNQTTYVNSPVNMDVSVRATGGTNPLVFTATNLPNWLTLDRNTGLLTGTAPATKSVTSSITLTVTDASNRTATTSTFKWIVTDLRLAIPDQWTNPGAAVTPMDIDTYLSGGTTPYTSPYTVTYSPSLPAGITYGTSSHIFGGTAPNTRTTAVVTVTVTDAQGGTVSDSFTWYVSSLRLTLGDQVTAPNTTGVSVDVDNYLSGGTPLSITVTGQPGWLVYNSTTHVLSGNAPASASPVTPVVITVQENSTFTFTKTITWYVSDLRWSGVPSTPTFSSTATTWTDMSNYDFGGTTPFTYRATGLPANVTINPGTGLITATGTTTKTTYNVTVTVTDVTGAFVTTSPIFVTVN